MDEVYPRLRGGSVHALIMRLQRGGLSPPTRGIPRLPMPPSNDWRSIPAYAGDPPFKAVPIRRRRVYPRLRGGSILGTTNIMAA